MPTKIYLVGSWTGGRKGKFIYDRAYLDMGLAIKYCESRKNARYDWVVAETEPGKAWISTKFVHTTPRSNK